jgi:hypothetical protein
LTNGVDLARTGVGTIIGRKSVSKGKEYARIWVYVPTKISEDTAFPLKLGSPCLIEIDEEKRNLVVKPISEKEAIKLGWRKRLRRKDSLTTIIQNTK